MGEKRNHGKYALLSPFSFYPSGSHLFSQNMPSITRHLCDLWGRTQTFEPWNWITKPKAVKHTQLPEKQSPGYFSFLSVPIAVTVLASLNHSDALHSELSLEDRNLLFILMIETDHWKKSGMRKDIPVTFSLYTCYGKKSSSCTSCITSKTYGFQFGTLPGQLRAV